MTKDFIIVWRYDVPQNSVSSHGERYYIAGHKEQSEPERDQPPLTQMSMGAVCRAILAKQDDGVPLRVRFQS